LGFVQILIVFFLSKFYDFSFSDFYLGETTKGLPEMYNDQLHFDCPYIIFRINAPG
jgi:hypothetical protein